MGVRQDGKKEYDYIPTTYYSFDVFAKNINPSEWEYEQNEYDDVIYDNNAYKKIVEGAIKRREKVRLAMYINIVMVVVIQTHFYMET